MELFSDDVADHYRDFVRYSTGSACLTAWAQGVADDPEVLAWIGALPPLKQQPNLVFAAARWHGVPAPGPYAGLRDALLGDDGTIRATIMARATQTNEVGRLATLLPALGLVAARTSEPLALVEVGASAGLCLYPDRYDYVWPPVGALRGSGGPTLTCEVTGTPPLPTTHPRIAWRGGIDLHPVDVEDETEVAWLETLVWPEQDERRARLRAAVEIARQDPPHLTTGDLLTELPRVVQEASAHGPVVVLHSAVVVYLDPEQRRAFHDLVGGLVADGACRWISNEAKQVLPDVTATGPPVPEDLGTFVLGLDGQALAWTHGHGADLRWLSPAQYT